MIKTLLFNIRKFIVWYVYQWTLIINFVRPRNYEISSVSLYYTSDKSARSRPVTNSFWREETVYPGQDEYRATVTDEFMSGKLRRILRRCPSDVTGFRIEIKYTYNQRTYKLLAYNRVPAWPPTPPTEMKFTLPIVAAYMISERDDYPIINVTKCINRYNGPHNNFHGAEIKIKDVVGFFPNFKRVKITNLIRQSVILDVDTGVLRYPLF